MFQQPMDPIVYDNPVDIHAFGTPLTEEEKQFKHLVPADKESTFAGRCTVDKCVKKIWEDSPLCKQHAYDMWFKVELNKHVEEDERVHKQLKDRAIMRQAELEYDSERIEQIEQEILEQSWRDEVIAQNSSMDLKTRPGMVYYLQVGEHIKIGFSSNVDERIKSYPPYAKLLAQHPGTVDTERFMHNRFFNSLAHGREWFRPSPELTQHIEEVVTKYHT